MVNARIIPATLLLALTCVLSRTVAGQDAPKGPELPRGTVVESVAALADARQTYALYLPNAYTPARRWPVLYCFDPMGRGAVPVHVFKEAAERFGWIVVGSNVSRNGPLKPSLEGAAAMFEDTQARLSVERGRVYAAGFSGGARTALRIHHLCGQCFAGVVAVGAGYPSDIRPAAPLRLSLFAAAGTDDFNFTELLALDALFGRLGAPHRFENFDGGHAWLTKELAADALEWMELRAVAEGRRPRDEAFTNGVWERRLAAARRARPDEAFRAYQSLAADFRGLRDVSEAAARAAALGETKEVRAALKDEAEQARRQERLASEMVALVEQRRGAGDERMQAAADFRRLLSQLREQARAAADTGARRVARRTLNQLFARFYEHALNLRHQKAGAGEVAAALETAAEFAPQSPRVFYELAVAHALDRERRKALAALRQAVDNGFADASLLEAEPAFEPLRADTEYRKLVESVKQTKK
jgi:predicted esterase